jgi:hypothetical protein
MKASWGNKRHCPYCGNRFYDLGKNPIPCPKCKRSLDIHAPVRLRRGKSKSSLVVDADDPLAKEKAKAEVRNNLPKKPVKQIEGVNLDEFEDIETGDDKEEIEEMEEMEDDIESLEELEDIDDSDDDIDDDDIVLEDDDVGDEVLIDVVEEEEETEEDEEEEAEMLKSKSKSKNKVSVSGKNTKNTKKPATKSAFKTTKNPVAKTKKKR